MGKWFNEFKRQTVPFGKEFKRQVSIFANGKSYKPNREKHHPRCSSTHRKYCGKRR